jgi:hypothetical protein
MKKRKREEYERWKDGFGYVIEEEAGSEGYSQIK